MFLGADYFEGTAKMFPGIFYLNIAVCRLVQNTFLAVHLGLALPNSGTHILIHFAVPTLVDQMALVSSRYAQGSEPTLLNCENHPMLAQS